MLGSMVTSVLRRAGIEILSTQRKDVTAPRYLDVISSSSRLDDILREIAPVDLIINCIGIIGVNQPSANQLQSAVLVNGIFPHRLQEAASLIGARVLHMSTDAVFRGRKRPYYEDSPCDCADIYGITKRLGEAQASNFLSIRCSIVGPERHGSRSLLQWFLSQPDGTAVRGYTNQIWNGVSTLQFAQMCLEIITEDKFDQFRLKSPVFHFSPNFPSSKYELLCIFGKAFKRNVTVLPDKGSVMITRILRSRHDHLVRLCKTKHTMQEVINELAAYMAREPKVWEAK